MLFFLCVCVCVCVCVCCIQICALQVCAEHGDVGVANVPNKTLRTWYGITFSILLKLDSTKDNLAWCCNMLTIVKRECVWVGVRA